MKEVFDTVVGIVFGVTPSQMSLLFFLHYLHCAGGWSVIVDPATKGYAQEWRIQVNAVNRNLLLCFHGGLLCCHCGVLKVLLECLNGVVIPVFVKVYSTHPVS